MKLDVAEFRQSRFDLPDRTAGVAIEVDVTEVASKADFYLGTACIHRDETATGFIFGIEPSAASFEVWRQIGDTGTGIADGEAGRVIRGPPASNHLRVECVDEDDVFARIAFFVNGRKVADATDTALGGFDEVALIVTSYRGSVEAYFDKLVVRSLAD